MVAAMDRWAAGTVAALERQSNGQVVTTDQIKGSLVQENLRLRDALALAHDEIARLQQKLATYQTHEGEDRLVNMTEAARLLEVHPSTISRWVAAGHFEQVRGAGAYPLLKVSSLVRPSPKKRGRKSGGGS